ncbi:hypothetical protein DSO57_1010027 [Entomophthora muscae]|uniref:Uncharacterized protein n=1 Tax=Entomophthora muscae TaxID=34485 RepID=A0ACC2RXT4_9FUNG|nr:hypothetical protein DSO57_1010027 [Entomophthora muscae]
MSQEALAELTNAKGASEWAVTAYKDAQLVHQTRWFSVEFTVAKECLLGKLQIWN